MSEVSEELRERARVLRELTPSQRKALGHPNPSNIDWEAWEALDRIHEEELERSEGYSEEREAEEIERKAEEAVEKASQALWKQELLNYLKEEKLADEREREAFEKNWEKEYGEDTVALLHHPFRSKSVIHKGDPR